MHSQKAIELYQQAGSMNTELPGLATKIADAREIEPKSVVGREKKCAFVAMLSPLCAVPCLAAAKAKQ